MKDLSDVEVPRLSDGRLELRPWRPDDASAVAAMCDDPSIARYIPLPSPHALTDGEEWVGDAERKWREDRWAQFAVTRRETGELVASCGVKIDVERRSGEIGYLVKQEARRTGVASGALRLLRAYDLVRGRRVDDTIYSLLPDDPRPGM